MWQILQIAYRKLFLVFLLGIVAASSLACSKANVEQGNSPTEKELDGDKAEKQKSLPIYQYYRKIPQIRGVTNDSENMIFNLKIELGYQVGDIKTLQKLNAYRNKIAGDVRASYAKKTKYYLGNLDYYPEMEEDILELVNRIIAPNPKDSERVYDVIISELFLHDYR